MTGAADLDRLTRLQRILYPLTAPIIALVIRICWSTWRIKLVIGEERLPEGPVPIIPCLWHQKLGGCLAYFLRRLGRQRPLGFLISPSKEGLWAGMTLRHLGGHPIHGSATRTGARAMRLLRKALTDEGVSPVMTPDGSRGPIFVFKQGPVMLGQISGAPLVPITCAISRYWQLRTWDRLMLPKPFAKIVIAIGEPRHVDRGTKLRDAAPVQEEMQAALNELTVQAEAALGRTVSVPSAAG